MNRPLRLAEWFVGICGMFATLSQSVSNVIGRPSAAVGADLSCPHIRKHPRNGERKRIFNNMETHIWLWKYTFLIMQGYGHDESTPTSDGMFRGHFVECSQPFHGIFVTH